MNVPLPPSVMLGESMESVGGSSSSAMVSVTSDGFANSPVAVPETVTNLSGAMSPLSTAVIVTVPVLVVAFAAMISVVPVSVKSVPAPGEVETVIVVAAVSSSGPASPSPPKPRCSPKSRRA